MIAVRLPAGAQFRAVAALRGDFIGMSDYYQAKGRIINACLSGLNAELFATFRSDDRVRINAGAFGTAEMRLPEIYEGKFGLDDQMLFKSLQMYPGHRLLSGIDVHIDCQYGAGGLSTSSSVAAAIHAFLRKIFNLPDDPWDMVHKVIMTEPHRYGRQDQLAVVYGGINMWEMQAEQFDNAAPLPLKFKPVRRYPLILCSGAETALAESILLYESGIHAGASQILQGVIDAFKKNPKEIQGKFDIMSKLALELWKVLNSHLNSSMEMAEQLGYLFNLVRDAHSSLHPDVMNARLTALIEAGLKAGATGARVTGAGGRGVLMYAVPSHKRAELEATLDKVNTPEPGSKKRIYGKIQRFAGFDHSGARCWVAKF